MDVSEFVFQLLSLFDSRSVFDKYIEYLTFIYIRKTEGTKNLFKCFLSMTRDESTNNFKK